MAYPAIGNLRETNLMSPDPEPMKHSLQNKNWSCRKLDNIRQLTGASDRVIFLHFRIFSVTESEKHVFRKYRDFSINL